ncbi:MAG: alpha-mannosidase [Galactobacter sp.]
MHQGPQLTLDRARRVLEERIRPAVHADAVPFTVESVQLPGEPEEARVAAARAHLPYTVGDPWGPAWGTTWFRLQADVPERFAGHRLEAVIDLGFETSKPGFQAEGLVLTDHLEPIKAVNPRNQWVPITDAAVAGERVVLRIEAASNPVMLDESALFQPTDQGDRLTASPSPLYRVARMDLTRPDPEVAELAADVDVALELASTLGETPRKLQLLAALDDALSALDLLAIPETAARARGLLAPALHVEAAESTHRLAAIGHSHIDTAWLWPLRETRRKVARTVSSMTTLLKEHPEFRYGMSSAQQYAWLKQDQPALWERVKDAVAEGRFEPLGGMWVESDTVMPSGESMVRQFLHGQRFFEAEFGKWSRGVWLPDSFGYSPALPQLMLRAGFEWFFTQKISWNQVNRFPHHTFEWEGIDGSRILTHFPPMDTYDAELNGVELERAQRQFGEAGRASSSVAPVGWGDGGGGTTREMLGRARRLQNLDGAPRVEWVSPDAFFETTRAELPQPPVWVGELYLELHRAVTTSQHHTKQGNRRAEHLLVEAEWWATAATVRCGAVYPYQELEELWRVVLTHQFHDILPGTAIAWVHREAKQTYAQITARIQQLIDSALETVLGEGDTALLANPTAFAHHGVAPGAVAVAAGNAARDTVSVERQDGDTILANGLVSFTFDAAGLITHAVDLSTGRDYSVQGRPGNLFQLHQDFPNRWDGWDVDSFYRDTVTDLVQLESLDVVAPDAPDAPDAAATVVLRRRFGESSLTQRLTLKPGERSLHVEQETDWRERERFLKLSFPLSVWAREATAETQYGFHHRPTHTNTSWEAAKFETSTQRWVLVGDRDGAVALANDSSHGFDVTRDMDHGAITTLRLSVLRAPRYPDPLTDLGVHRHTYALALGVDELDATELGQRLNSRPRTVSGAAGVAPLVTVSGVGVLLDAVKLAEDQSGDLVVRVHEARGRTTVATISVDAAATSVRSVEEVTLLEEPVGAAPGVAVAGLPGDAVAQQTEGGVTVALTPFSVRTFRFRLS